MLEVIDVNSLFTWDNFCYEPNKGYFSVIYKVLLVAVKQVAKEFYSTNRFFTFETSLLSPLTYVVIYL